MITKPIKLTHDSTTRIFFGSDFHLNHDKDFLWGKRGFASIQEHDDWIMEGLSRLHRNDTLIYVGDFSLNSTPEQTAVYLELIPCNIYYIWGNHESWVNHLYEDSKPKFPGVNDHFEMYPLWTTLGGKEICFLGNEAFFNINHHLVYASHFPHLVWDKMAAGTIHVCGHSHGSCDVTNGSSNVHGKIMDVGVDCAQRQSTKAPIFSWETVRIIMEKRSIKIIDHHR